MAGNLGEKNVWWIAQIMVFGRFFFNLGILLTRQFFSYIQCKLVMEIFVEYSQNNQLNSPRKYLAIRIWCIKKKTRLPGH